MAGEADRAAAGGVLDPRRRKTPLEKRDRVRAPCAREIIGIERMATDRKLKASREGSK